MDEGSCGELNVGCFITCKKFVQENENLHPKENFCGAQFPTLRELSLGVLHVFRRLAHRKQPWMFYRYENTINNLYVQCNQFNCIN